MPWIVATFSDPAIARHVLNPVFADARIADVLARYPSAKAATTEEMPEWNFDCGGALLGSDRRFEVALAPDRVIRIWRHHAELLLRQIEFATTAVIGTHTAFRMVSWPRLLWFVSQADHTTLVDALKRVVEEDL